MTFQKLNTFGPLPIRIVAGIAFILHGAPKLQNIVGTQGFFSSISLPAELAVVIGLLEVIGGFALLFGIFTRIASALFIVEMIGSTLAVKMSRGFIGGYEIDMLLMAISTSLLITGPGRISVEWNILKREMFPGGRTIMEKQRQLV
jgi:putative oxidoreductase